MTEELRDRLQAMNPEPARDSDPDELATVFAVIEARRSTVTVDKAHDTATRVPRRGLWNRPVAVFAGMAIVIVLAVGVPMLLFGGEDAPTADTAATTAPPTTPETAPPTTAPTQPATPTTIAEMATPPPPPDPSQPPPFTLASEILPASEAPFELRWISNQLQTTESPDVPELIKGWGCYGGGFNQVPHATVEFDGGHIDFKKLGNRLTPNVDVTDGAGNVTEVGNPFGPDAWLCGVAANDSVLLAVGSGAFWSDDGITWHGIEAFEEYVWSEMTYSGLLWAAAGTGGYMILSQDEWIPEVSDGRAWFSEDLQSWYEIPREDPEGSCCPWGYAGPDGIAVGEEPIIVTFEGAWVATRP